MSILDVDGVPISYKVIGTGVPVVFIPPPMIGSVVFQYQVAELSRELQVILFDLRGHGKSGTSDRPLTYAVIARDIRAILDALDIEKAVICGYSMGGSIVFEFMKLYPERTLGGIPVSGFSEATDIRLRTEISTAVALLTVHAMRTLSVGLALANANSVSLFRELFSAGIRSKRDDVKALFQYALKYNCTDDLPHLDGPMRLIFGGSDGRLNRYVRILKKSLPNKEVVHIRGVSHQIPAKKYRELNKQIRDFVSELR